MNQRKCCTKGSGLCVLVCVQMHLFVPCFYFFYRNAALDFTRKLELEHNPLTILCY